MRVTHFPFQYQPTHLCNYHILQVMLCLLRRLQTIPLLSLHRAHHGFDMPRPHLAEFLKKRTCLKCGSGEILWIPLNRIQELVFSFWPLDLNLNMAQAKYTLVRHDQAIDNDELFQYLRQRSERNTGRCISWLSILLLISGLSNVLLLYQLRHQCSIAPISRSQYGEYSPFPSLFASLLNRIQRGSQMILMFHIHGIRSLARVITLKWINCGMTIVNPTRAS